MAYEGSCGSCGMFEDAKTDNLYDTSNPDYIKGFCRYYRSYYYPTENACNHYLKRGGGSSSDCYITTIVCNILGRTGCILIASIYYLMEFEFHFFQAILLT